MYSYVYFSRYGSAIHHWFYDENGKKQYKKENAPMFFFMQSDEGDYTSIYGHKLKKVSFDSYSKLREAREMFKSAGKDLFESDVDVENRFVLEQYANVNISKKPVMDTHFVDIEVHSESGFPDPEKAEHPITIITVYSTKRKKFIVLTYKEFDRNFKVAGQDKPFLKDTDIVKIYKNEAEMLEGYISLVKTTHPDFISGWNSSGYDDKNFAANGFDIPYIINRIKVVFDNEDKAKQLSPLKIINKIVRKHSSGQDKITYEIVGINIIDYLALYKKYHQGEQESFKLDYIAKVEIHENKVKYDGSLVDLYHKNWQKYVEYNIQDVNLLKVLDEKLQFLDMMIGICYNCKCLFDQFSKTTRILDGAFMSRLSLEKVILPDPQMNDMEGQYVGAYVKEPVPGIYDWVVSFDATSLYPSVMMQHNISPETKMMVVNQNAAHIIMDALSGEELTKDELAFEADESHNCQQVVEIIKKNGYTIASNGAIYRHDKPGIVASFVKEWFDKRRYHKKLMEKAQAEGNVDEEKTQKGLQHNYKILINSVYGALGSKYFRLYDKDNATAVTLTSQDIIKTTIACVEDFFMKQWGTTDIGKKLKATNLSVSPIIYSDTDSLYINCGAILKSFNYPHYENLDMCKEYIENTIEKLLFKIIDSAMKKLTMKRMHATECLIGFKREMIARRIAFLAKKYYSAWVLKMETHNIKAGDEHELETKGHVMVTSKIPEKVRDMMKEFVLDLLKNPEKKKSDELLRKMSQDFKNMPIQSICRITNINGLQDYTGPDGEPIKGCPGHVKASIGYNQMIKRKNLENDYEMIHEGDKIKMVYVKETPYYRFSTIAFKNDIPKEFGLKEFVDYDIMWNKIFIEPIKPFYEIQRWQMPSLDQEDISDLFA